jgi:hypothetical protein
MTVYINSQQTKQTPRSQGMEEKIKIGQRYALMTMNGISSNNTKYQETKFENCTYSVLTIKSFDQTDVDIVYKCTYGFSSYEHVLELKSREYECM